MMGKRESGSVLVMIALLLPVFCVLAMMGLDFGRAYMMKSTLQNAADAAALAGVVKVAEGPARLIAEADVPSDSYVTTDGIADANRAADDILEENLEENGEVRLLSKEQKLKAAEYSGTGGAVGTRYYEVKLVKRVAFEFGRMILPASFLPGGWTVSARAWAMAGDLKTDVDLETKLRIIRDTQTYKDFQEIERELGSKTEGRYRSESSKGIYYLLDDEGNPLRREYVHMGHDLEPVNITNLTEDGDRRDGKLKSRWLDERDLYINFKPDISSSSLLPNWDIGQTFDAAKMRISNMLFQGMPTNWAYADKTKADVVAQFVQSFSLTEEAAEKLVDRFIQTPVLSTIDVSHLYQVRGTPEELKAMWQANKKSVATDFKGRMNQKILENDPLLVRIESDEMNARTTGRYYENTVREFEIDIKVDNYTPKLDEDHYRYRPMVFFYDRPTNTNALHNPLVEIRETRLMTLNLQEDFRGIIFAPNSPVKVLGNGHKFRGLIVAKSIMGADGVELEMPTTNYDEARVQYRDFYQKLGISEATYDDFGLVNLTIYTNQGTDIVYLTERAKVTR